MSQTENNVPDATAPPQEGVAVSAANIPIPLHRLPAGVRGASLPDVGHWPHVHAPDATNRLITAFLDTLSGDSKIAT
jgi:pimeloyl-ACP methyl ester carboxylesterase